MARRTLREAILLANQKPTSSKIDCSNLFGTIVLEKDLPLITGYTVIQGSGIANLAISASSAHRIFSVSGNITVEIHDLTLREAFAKGGKGGDGGGSGGGGGGGMGAALFLNKGTVYCESVDFINNKVQGGAGGGEWIIQKPDVYGGGGGFAGDGQSFDDDQDSFLSGGDGGILGEEGRGGKAVGNWVTAGDGGFGGGGGANVGYAGNDYTLLAGDGGFGGGGGGSEDGDGPGQGGFLAAMAMVLDAEAAAPVWAALFLFEIMPN